MTRADTKHHDTLDNHTVDVSLDDAVRILYYDARLTQMEVADKLGISRSTINRIFRKNSWKPHRIMCRAELDTELIHHLYFDKELTQEEVAKEIGVSRRTIIRLFKDHTWVSHGQSRFESEEARVSARREKARLFRKELTELRRELFGTECSICGDERQLAIHRKDDTDHHKDELWRKSILESVNRDDWAALCIPCHRGIHWLIKSMGFTWEELMLRVNAKRDSVKGNRDPLCLPNETAASSIEYLELAVRFGGSSKALRRALFGERCHFCGVHYREKRVVIHRKDGRSHSPKLTNREKYFRTLNTADWVALCQKHHRYVHWAMETLGFEWCDLA